ncbi:phage tail length tape measure family protein [Leptothrix sp. BB-4]
MADQQIRIVLTADPSAAQQGLKQVDQALAKTAASTKVSAAQTAAAMRTLPAQFTDIATQLQGGASPLTVLLQQGGQIKDSFGGVVPALRGVGAAIGPMLTNPLTLAAAAAGALALAFEQGREEDAQFRRSLILTGNSAGATASQLSEMAKGLDASSFGITRGAAADVIATLVNQGGIAADQLDHLAEAALKLARAGGPAAEETAKAFAALGKDPVQASIRYNEAMNYLTASTLKQIKALQDQGRTVEAAKLAQNSYADAVLERTPQLEKNIGLLQKAWRGTASTAAEAWDAMLGIGREDTLAQKIAQTRAAIEANSRRTDTEDSIGPNGRRNGAATRGAQLREQLRLLMAQQRVEENTAKDAVAKKEKTDKAVEGMSDKHQAALAGIDRAGAARRLAQTNLQLGTATALYDKAFAREQISSAEHAEAMRAIGLARLDAEEKNLNELKAIEAKRSTTSDDDRKVKSAALEEFETRRLGIQERRVALQLKEIDNGMVLQGFNLFKEPDDSAATLERIQASIQAQGQLADATERLKVTQIADAESRGRALIAIEARQIRERLDLDSRGADARRQAEDQLADYIEARTAELIDSLKPQWERMVEDYQDSSKLIRESNDTIMSGLLRDSEDMWVQWVTAGKFSARQLVNGVLTEMARLQFRQLIGSGAAGDSTSGVIGLIGAYLGGQSAAADLATINAGSGTYDFADAIRGNRATGGPVSAGGLYQVNELGTPELLTVGNRSFLMMGNQAGNVTPGNAAGGSIHVTINNTVGDVVTSAQLAAVAERTRQAAIAGVADARLRGRT